jgi:cell division initiation protein
MSMTPVEIRHVKLGRRLLGYDRKAADRLLDDVIRSFEDVWRDRADLREEIERLETELAHYKDLEALLKSTLVSAERAADELRVQARREGDVLVEEARVKARELVDAAEREREQVRTEVRRLKALETEMRSGYRAFLLAALERVDGENGEPGASDQAAA